MCAVWGVLIELRGWICPLTPLENRLRRAAGGEGYTGGFIEHYITPVIYPDGLTRGTQVVLGIILVAFNLAVYCFIYARRSADPASARAGKKGDRT